MLAFLEMFVQLVATGFHKKTTVYDENSPVLLQRLPAFKNLTIVIGYYYSSVLWADIK